MFLRWTKPRLLHSRNKVKDPKGAKRIVSKLTYVYGSSLSEYLGTGADKDEKHLKDIYVRENLSCSSHIEIPYYAKLLDHYPKVCIYCGVSGTTRTLGNNPKYYPKCVTVCKDKPNINSRKRKTVEKEDLTKSKKKNSKKV